MSQKQLAARLKALDLKLARLTARVARLEADERH